MTDLRLTAAQARLLAAVQTGGQVFYRPGRGNHVWEYSKPDAEKTTTVTTSMNGLVYMGLVERPISRGSGAGRLTDSGERWLAEYEKE